MNIFLVSLKNISSRKLSSTLSILLLTLGVGLIALIVQVQHHFKEQINHNLKNIDMVVGAKGSPLQLILSAVYHIDDPTGNISLKEVKQLQKNRLIESTIPLSYGDSYKGFRIVGTEHSYPAMFNATLAKGKDNKKGSKHKLWKRTFEVTLGAAVTQKTGLKLGDTFSGSHGLIDGGDVHDDQKYAVVGVFNYSNSVLDNLILTSTQSVWDVHAGHDHDHDGEHETHDEHNHGDKHDEHNHAEEHKHEDHEHEHGNESEEHHKHEHHDHAQEHDHELEYESHEHKPHDNHDEDRQITALLVKFKNPIGLMQVPRFINENTNMQAAIPVYEMDRLLSIFGVGISTLNILALVIILVSGLSIFISLYNSLNERKYELALLRTYGANKLQLVWLVLQESLILSLTGFALGMFSSRIAFLLFTNGFKATQNFINSINLTILPEEVFLFGGICSIALIASLIPAISIFRLNISKTLSDA